MWRRELTLAACSAGVLAGVGLGVFLWFQFISYVARQEIKRAVHETVLPLLAHEPHLTDWEGLSGGASPGATPVKAIYVRKPVGVP